jgi:ectoine hydroxylase-related dioxygenase (phytanoyl-CoA dioxygenase family)
VLISCPWVDTNLRQNRTWRIEGDFQRDGAVCVRGAVSPEHLELAAEAIEANLADLSPLGKRASADSDGAFVEDFCNWSRLPSIEKFIRESGAAAIAAELMGATTVRLYHDHVLVKEPGTRQRTPWHQDQPYYNVEGRQNASMWLPVDPVSRASTLELVAGSHRGEWYMPRTFLDDQAKWFPEGSLTELPDIDGRPDDFTILGWELEPGDAAFFHMLTLHAAGGVPGPDRRRVLSVRFLGDDAVHAPRAWTTSPPFPGLIDELPAGAPMDHPLFPVLWTRPQ